MNVRAPFLLRWLYPEITYRIPKSEKKLYLTFDDGPIPEITEQVLDLLKHYDTKATFFCVGENVKKHPYLYDRILQEHHAVGNHTFHHVNGFKSNCNVYLDDTLKAASCISSNLFRPPYGRLTPKQYHKLRNEYHIVMWDVLSYDFDAKVTRDQCLDNVMSRSRNGSIIVFHDSIKAAANMLYVLPLVLKHFKGEGYTFETISINHK